MNAPDPARTQVLQHVSAILSALLDMAHGTLPADDFAISIVVRYRHLDTGHMLVGDDGEDQIIGALEAIKRQSGFVGTSTADPAEVIIGAARPGATRTCPRCVEPVSDITITRCPQCGADMPEVKRDVVIRDEPPELLLDQVLVDTPTGEAWPIELLDYLAHGYDVAAFVCNRAPLDAAELDDVTIAAGKITRHGGELPTQVETGYYDIAGLWLLWNGELYRLPTQGDRRRQAVTSGGWITISPFDMALPA